MIILFAAFAVLSTSFFVWLLWGWIKVPQRAPVETIHKFSVVIPVRNESQNLPQMVGDLANQLYELTNFEVIIVDDFSEDDTAKVMQELLQNTPISLRYIQLEASSEGGKKRALSKGVQAAVHDIILTTDADCRLPSTWLAAYNNYFVNGINMVAGPVMLTGSSLFLKIQQLEFAGLIGFGGVTISKNIPSMCSGANLGFRKTAFLEVGGYKNNLFIPSGDDEFLLFNIMSQFPRSVSFMKDMEGMVCTQGHTSWKQFLNQRIRWTSKWKYHRNPVHKLLSAFFFLDHVLQLVLLFGAVFHLFPWQTVALLLSVRMISSAGFIAVVHTFFKRPFNPLLFLALHIFYPLHVLFMGLSSIFGRYTWKGRKY